MKIHHACPIFSQHNCGSWAHSNAVASGKYGLDTDVDPHPNVPLSFRMGKRKWRRASAAGGELPPLGTARGTTISTRNATSTADGTSRPTGSLPWQNGVNFAQPENGRVGRTETIFVCLTAVVAPLVRAPDCGSGGRWFESTQPYHPHRFQNQ